MSLALYEFECPEHGRFEALVDRVDGGPPDFAPCSAHRTHRCSYAYECASCYLHFCTVCDLETETENIKTAVRWCDDCVEEEARENGVSVDVMRVGRDERRASSQYRCNELSPWTISAPMPKVLSVPCFAAVRGGDMKDRPPHMLDTRPLAEGQTKEQWRRVQAGKREERRWNQLRKMGAVTKKIIV